jgi:hypothetical protein
VASRRGFFPAILAITLLWLLALGSYSQEIPSQADGTTPVNKSVNDQPAGTNPPSLEYSVRYTRNAAGESKPVILEADEIAIWTESDFTFLLLRGQAMVQLGVVQLRCQSAIASVNLKEYKSSGIWKIRIHAENLFLDTSAESKQADTGLIELNTRGEFRYRAANNRVTRESLNDNPVFQRGKSAITKPNTAKAHVAKKPLSPQPPSLPPGQQPPVGPITGQQPPESNSLLESPAKLLQIQNLQPGPSPKSIPNFPSPATNTNPLLPPRLEALPGMDQQPYFESTEPIRQFSLTPRTSEGFNFSFGPRSGNEQALLVSGGIILSIKDVQGIGLLDMEADRIVLWTKGANIQEMMDNLRSSKGETTKELEIYLSGNVEVRQLEPSKEGGKPPQTRTIKADEVFYDVRRNTAVALNAEMQFFEPRIPDPVFVRARELQRLNVDQFRVYDAELFASQTPAEPGLKLYMAEAKLEQRKRLRTGLFGNPIVDRTTGQTIEYTESLTKGKNAFIKAMNVPIFWLPFFQGDARDPLGPIESLNIGFSNIFGGQFGTSLNAYDLIGMQPLENTKWRMDLDYLTKRGPGIGTDFTYLTKDILGKQDVLSGGFLLYGIHDTGQDVLGGGRGTNDGHPEWRGRASWRQLFETQNGFTAQANLQALSDQNYFEQYWKNEFDTDPVQSTDIYLRQELGYNMAGGVLGQYNILPWYTDTNWLPKADFWMTGQSFFDLISYNTQVGLGYGQIQNNSSNVGLPQISPTDAETNAGRFHWMNEVSVPFSLGAFRLSPYVKGDLAYYTETINNDSGNGMGRAWGGPGVRLSLPFSALYSDVTSDLFNVNGLNHKVQLGLNYSYLGTTAQYTNFGQFDRLNDDATNQSMQQIRPLLPTYNPQYGATLATSMLYDPQTYAIRKGIDTRFDTLNDVQSFQMDIRQRLQTKRGLPGNQHVVDWMVLDVAATAFPESSQNFGSNWAFMEYNYIWNIGDRTTLVSNGWLDPIENGARTFQIGGYYNRSDRTSLYLGFRDIFPVESRPLTAGFTYIFSPKYAISAFSSYDFGTNMSLANSVVFSRTGTDVQVNLGFTYNAMQNNFGFVFEILPRVVANAVRGGLGVSPGLLSGY